MSLDAEDAGRQMPVLSKEQGGKVAKPPHPLDDQWYMNVEGQTFGPCSGHELKEFAEEGRIERDTQVNRIGTEIWVEAGTDTALKRLFAQAGKPPLTASRRAGAETAHTGDNGTIIQVTNTIHTPLALSEPGFDKSPGLALFLSFIFVGLGQIYNGDVGKGIMMFIGCILLWAIFLGWIINIWSMIDAYGRAKELRQKHQIYMASLRAA